MHFSYLSLSQRTYSARCSMLDPILCTTTVNAVDILLRGTTCDELDDGAGKLIEHLDHYPSTTALLQDFWYSENLQIAR